MASARTWFVGLSLVGHGIFAVAIGEIEIPKSHAATAIEIAEIPQPKPEPPEPAKALPEPPKPAQERSAARAKAAAPAPASETPPPASDSQPSSLDALPDFGLSLSGGIGGGGMSVPSGGGGAPRATGPAQPKRLAASVPKPAGDGCEEPAGKPKPISVPQPAATPQAQAAQIQGKVRVQLTVDETGRVVDVKLLQGLGYGLDEAALAAARAAKFEPAMRCGKPTRATFNISMRFTL